MRALLVIVALLAASATAQVRDRRCGHKRDARMGTCDGFAFFEFAPTSGAGMPAACSTTTPTGAKGETLTFTRASDAMCNKTNATSGVANGDFVLLTTNQPRIGSVSGVLAFLRETSRTNSCLRSQELSNAVWSAISGGGPVAPTVTANAGVGPDGTTTAERIQIPAVTGAARFTMLRQTIVTSQKILCLWARSFTGAGAQTFWLSDGAAGTNPATNCSANESGWNLCSVLSGTSGSINFDIGTNTFITAIGVGPHPSADVLVTFTDAQDGAWCTMPIPTVAAAATRQAESALSVTLTAGIGPDFSLGASTAYTSTAVTTATAVQLGTAAPNLASVGRSTNTAATFTINATSTTPAVSAMGTSLLRGSLNDASGTRTAFWNSGSVSAPAASMSASTTALSFGALDAYTARVCADPLASRCDQ